jgi:predicted regulator of Ras-like GTPase activity (Roadblock/LC7/MglB family)
MNEQVYAFALENTLNEIEKVCSDVSNTFIFKEDGNIIAKDKNTDEEIINRTVGAFKAITERANSIGGLESVTIHDANGQVNITCIEDFYLATITSKEADERYVNTLTRVLVPTVLKLIEKIHPASIDSATLATLEHEPAWDNDVDKIIGGIEDREEELPVEETDATEPEPEPIEEESDSEVNPEPLLPEPPVNQFIVENLGGLVIPSDTVRIGTAVIEQWKNLYSDKKIAEVDVETLNGKTTRCKFKPIKDSKHEGKGIIQMPQKIQHTLQTTKGELVMVKPVVK